MNKRMILFLAAAVITVAGVIILLNSVIKKYETAVIPKELSRPQALPPAAAPQPQLIRQREQPAAEIEERREREERAQVSADAPLLN